MQPQAVDAVCEIVKTERLAEGYHRLRLSPRPRFWAEPGQFVMVRVSTGVDPLLRRPFGIHSFDDESGEFEILFREAGKGTAILAKARVGDTLEIMAPLGRGFADFGKRPLLVGGGIGVAPLLFTAERLLARGVRPKLLLGGRSDRDILCHGDFDCLAVPCAFATEDGSLGETGLVTTLLAREIESHPPSERFQITVHACGPIPMLAAVARLCEGYTLHCEVSLESHMACGVGACLGCVVKGKGDANLRVCKEGPVFQASQIDWP